MTVARLIPIGLAIVAGILFGAFHALVLPDALPIGYALLLAAAFGAAIGLAIVLGRKYRRHGG